MTDAKGESIEKQRKWYAKNVNTFSDMTMDIIYVDEEMTVVLELNFMKVAIKEIFSYILRILCAPCTAVFIVLDGGLDTLDPADAKNALVVHINMGPS